MHSPVTFGLLCLLFVCFLLPVDLTSCRGEGHTNKTNGKFSQSFFFSTMIPSHYDYNHAIMATYVIEMRGVIAANKTAFYLRLCNSISKKIVIYGLASIAQNRTVLSRRRRADYSDCFCVCVCVI